MDIINTTAVSNAWLVCILNGYLIFKYNIWQHSQLQHMFCEWLRFKILARSEEGVSHTYL